MAREGFPFIFAGCALTFLFSYLGLVFVSVLTGMVSLFIVFFFRDPDRENIYHKKAVLTPADGRVLEIQHIKSDNNPLGQPAIKVSVFMSLFNVHVNRIPIEGTIKRITYHPGKFFSANLDKASKLNENNSIILQTTDSCKIVLVQIAGLIARRIACWVKEQDHVFAGQRFGLIRFGSRMEIYLPDDSQIIVEPRQRVKGGETILGYLL